MRKTLLLLVPAVLLSGCTWGITPTPASQNVRTAWNSDVSACRDLGKVTVSVLNHVGPVDRNDIKVRDELQVMFADDPADARGFRTVYSGPAHPYGAGLWPIPALGIGYSETKIVECFDFFSAIVSGKQPSPNFEDGYKTERVADALIESGESGQWTKVRS